MKELVYKPYFMINGVGVCSKAYAKEKHTLYFYTSDNRLLVTMSGCKTNYDWNKCKKLFGDKEE